MPSITITSDGLNLMRDATNGVNALTVLYAAVGTSNTAPTVNDHKLGAEAFRKRISSVGNGAAIGEALNNLYLSPGDAVGVVIAEVGFFAGSTASLLPNTGVLVARGLYAHTKTNLESIQLQFDITY